MPFLSDVTSRDLLKRIARSRDYHRCAVITEFHFYSIIIKYKSFLRHKYIIIRRIGTFCDVFSYVTKNRSFLMHSGGFFKQNRY